MMSFIEVTGEEYTKRLEDRLQGKTEEVTWLRQFRKLLLPYLKPGTTMIDIGCATGYAFNSFSQFRIKYLGVDFEKEYIDIARKWFKDEPRANFLLHDIAKEPLSFPFPQADIVICSGTLEHCASMMPALKNIIKAAKSIVMLRTFIGPGRINSEKRSLVPGYEDHFKYYNQYSHKEIIDAFIGMGFSEIQIFPDEYTNGQMIYVEEQGRYVRVVMAKKPE